MNINIKISVSEKYETLESCEIDVSAPTLNPKYFRELVADCVDSALTKAAEVLAGKAASKSTKEDQDDEPL